MYRIVIAPDSFKESLSAPEVASAIALGIRRVFPDAMITTVPMADGGEGLTDTLVAATGGKKIRAMATGPLGMPVETFWGLLGDGTTAVVEMAQASGLALVPPELRNPMMTTTRGTGELIQQALAYGCKKLIVGIGGSATNDCGAGMAQALGVKLIDKQGQEVVSGARGLENLDRIDTQGMDPHLKDIEILVACDVDNPLCGPQGATYVYAPQKGATPEILPRLDTILSHTAEIIHRDLGIDIKNLAGSGAAGGMGAGSVAFLGAQLKCGIELVLETVQFDEILSKGADLVITGEGEMNSQTVHGKVPIGVARIAMKYHIPVIAIVGSIGKGANEVYEHGIKGFIPIVPRPVSLKYSMKYCAALLADAAERLVHIYF